MEYFQIFKRIDSGLRFDDRTGRDFICIHFVRFFKRRKSFLATYSGQLSSSYTRQGYITIDIATPTATCSQNYNFSNQRSILLTCRFKWRLFKSLSFRFKRVCFRMIYMSLNPYGAFYFDLRFKIKCLKQKFLIVIFCVTSNYCEHCSKTTLFCLSVHTRLK